MKAKELIEALQNLCKLNKDAIVILHDGENYYDFSGFSVDDNNNVLLFVVGDDDMI